MLNLETKWLTALAAAQDKARGCNWLCCHRFSAECRRRESFSASGPALADFRQLSMVDLV
jgi:hypothetical protein